MFFSVVVVTFQECLHVLMEGTPRNADMPRLRRQLLEVRERERTTKKLEGLEVWAGTHVLAQSF